MKKIKRFPNNSKNDPWAKIAVFIWVIFLVVLGVILVLNYFLKRGENA